MFIYTLEILGLDPKITICKIVVLPIKLYPLNIINNIILNHLYLITQLGIEPRHITMKMLCLNLLDYWVFISI